MMAETKEKSAIDRQSFRESKRGGNWAVFSLILGFCVLLFIITIIRML